MSSILDNNTTPKLYGLSNLGSVPKTSGVLSGYSLPNQTQTQNSGLMSGGQSVQSPISGGTNAGIIPKDITMKDVSTPPVVNVGGKSQVMKGTPSVLAQQQALNKLGAGLVEDGIAGALTKAAIAKYGSSASTVKDTSKTSTAGATSEVLPKAGNDPSNQYNTDTGQPNTNWVNANNPAQTNYNPANQANFPGLINTQANISGNAANTGAENYNTANTGLINSLGQNQVLSQRAQDIANTAGQTMSDIGQKGAMGQAGYRTTGTSPVGEGNAAVLAQTTAAQQNAVAQGANMELQGTSQGLTAQGQTQSGFNQAGSMGLTGQGQGITGLNNTTGQVSPQLGQYGQGYYNPLNAGQGGGQVQPSDPFYATLQSYAQMAASGQYGAIPSSVTGNAVLNDQMNQMAKVINPNYNPVTSAAQTGISTTQAGNVAQMTASYQSATNLGSQLKDLITTYGVNPADLNAANAAIQKVAQNVSSPQYQALNNLVTDIIATYSSILTPGSTTDTARATAASLLNDTASGKSIITTLNNLDDQAKAKIAGQTTSYGANPGTPSGGTSTSGFGWNG